MSPGTVAVIGPGAVGGLVAAGLARGGFEVLLVGRDPGWLRRVRREGLRVSGGPFGNGTTIPPKRLRAAIRPPGHECAAVFLCVKAPDTARALEAARRLAGPRTAIVSLQNGLGHRAPIARAFGRARSVFGSCYFAADRVAPLHVRHRGGDRILLGAHPGNAAALRLAKRLLSGSGWKVAVARSEDRVLWTKAVGNAALNPLGALTRRTNDELARIPALRELLVRAVREASAAARAAGHPPLYRNMERLVIEGCRASPGQRNSMLQDLESGRPTEVESILGPLLEAARRRGVKTRILDALRRFVRRLQRELGR